MRSRKRRRRRKRIDHAGDGADCGCCLADVFGGFVLATGAAVGLRRYRRGRA